MDRASFRALLIRALREPLLHFLLIGIAVFALYQAGSPLEPASAQRVIEVTPAQVERLAGQFEAVWRRRPSEAELTGLVEDFVREEVYYREALALGLDRDDTVIRRRLRQKMEFLSDAGAGAMAPDEGDLRAHFADHVDRFTPAARVTFRQVFLGDADAAPVLGGAGRRGRSGDARARHSAAAGDGGGHRDIGGRVFGDGFFAAVSALAPGAWRGPVVSAFGPHLVQLVELDPAAPPSFETVRSEVEEDWRRQYAEDVREAQYRALRERYEVVLPTAQVP